jgi:glycosyltransferase A (GT-A) superfamily protein (DUF2064 family)
MASQSHVTATDPAVVIMARAPRRGEVRRALEPLLGAERCVTLQATLIRETAGWGRDIAPKAVHIAHDPPDAAALVRPLVPAGTILFPQNGDGISGRLADAAARVFARHAGPVLFVWPDLPRFRPDHARAALGDLSAGCDVVLGPALEGGFYLIGVKRPLPKLFALPEQAWRNPDAMALAASAVRAAGLELGILRAERALHRPVDVRAALADPLLGEEIARILGKPRAANEAGSHELT